MDNEITLLKNNSKRDWTDLEWIEEFYEFLQGGNPKEIDDGNPNTLKLTKKKAFFIIWYLQEHFSIFPDTIEQCNLCKNLYDSASEGYHSDKSEKFFCGSCDDGKD